MIGCIYHWQLNSVDVLNSGSLSLTVSLTGSLLNCVVDIFAYAVGFTDWILPELTIQVPNRRPATTKDFCLAVYVLTTTLFNLFICYDICF